ncbi:hypothetical protein [Streptomyces sp. NPDC001410]|uniref:hypothetical protein n=1 Tax=Streptomyces sp. NPDC001410 TaxID=3364574 RepID=UPI00367905FD
MSADRLPLGKVGSRRWALRDGEWTVIQDGLGELTGESVGVGTKLRPDSRLGNLIAVPASEFAFITRLDFRSPESAGFELTRLRGVRARCAATIHDDRVNRLLVLDCVANNAEHHAQEAASWNHYEMTSKPRWGLDGG